MKIAIIGAGAIGSYVTARFAVASKHTLFLLARGTYDAIKSKGITVTDEMRKTSYHTNRFNLYNDPHHIPPCDLIILATKAGQNSVFLPQIASLYSPNTVVISLQNGLNFEDEILKTLPKGASLYSGTSWIKVTPTGPGWVRHDFGDLILLGRHGPGTHATLQSIFDSVGFDLDLVENIQSVQLTKLALNVPLFILIAKEGQTVPEILANPVLNQKRIQLQTEIVDAAIKIKAPVDLSLIEKMTTHLKKIPVSAPPSRTELARSMHSELSLNAATLIQFMHQKGVSLPLIENEEILKS